MNFSYQSFIIMILLVAVLGFVSAQESSDLPLTGVHSQFSSL